MKVDRVILEVSIVAGILAVLIVSILLGFALVGVSSTNSDSIYPPINLDSKEFRAQIVGIDPYLSGSNSIVPVAYSGCWTMDTKKGTMTVINRNLPEELPLCLTQDVLDNYNFTVVVTGGYSPVVDTSSIRLYQKGAYKGTIDVVFTNMPDACVCPCTEYYLATFKLRGNCPIVLDSNKYPDGAIIPDGYTTIPGKEVCLCACSTWEGCSQVDQSFKFIRAHQHILMQTPTPHEVLITLIASQLCDD
jgi:hypothetical protein